VATERGQEQLLKGITNNWSRVTTGEGSQVTAERGQE
jgi:hypothetical protein